MTRLAPALLLASALTLSGGRPLPRGLAGPPQRTTGCEAFGAGFTRLAGSDTCVKLGGGVRAEYGINVSGSRR